MTWFLKPGQVADRIEPTTPDLAPSTLVEGIGAEVSQMMRGNNGLLQRERAVNRERNMTAVEAAKVLGREGLTAFTDEFNREYVDTGRYAERLSPDMAPEDIVAASGVDGPRRLLELAREKVVLDPAAGQGVDLSPEGIDARVTARRAAEDKEEAQIISMMPNRRGLAAFIGGTIGSVADIRQVPLAFISGGGSFLQQIGLQGLLGAASEAVTLPSQFAVAKELGKPAPNVGEALTYGAVGGAVLGGVVEGAARLPALVRGLARNAVPAPIPAVPGLHPVEAEAAVRSAQEAMLADENPLEAVERAMQGRGPLAEEVTPEPTAPAPSTVYGDDARNDINLTLQEMLDDAVALGARGNIGGLSVIPTDIEYLKAGAAAFLDGRSEAPTLGSRQASALAEIGYYKARQQVQSLGYEPVSTGPIERPPLIPDEVMSEAPTPPVATAEGLAPDTVTAQPTLKQTINGRPKGPAPSNLSTFVVNSGGIWKGSDRGDLAALDYRRPGFLKAKKLERSSAGNNGGGRTIDEMREMAVEAGYLPQGATVNDFLDALSRDAKGQRVYAQADMAAAMDAEAYRAARLDEERPNTATADYLAMQPAPRGLFIDLEKGDGFLTPDDIASKVNDWIDESEFATILTPSERAEIISTVQARGGDVEYLVERVLEREADYVEAPDGAADRTTGGASGADGRGDVPFGVVPGEAGGSGAGQGGRGGTDPAQLPGFDRIQTGDAQRNAATVAAQALQSKIRRLNQTRVEDDAGGLFGGAQQDFFDDITSPAAQSYLEAQIADIRQALDDGDLELPENPAGLVTEDGRQLSSAADVLDEIDELDALEREYAACLAGKAVE